MRLVGTRGSACRGPCGVVSAPRPGLSGSGTGTGWRAPPRPSARSAPAAPSAPNVVGLLGPGPGWPTRPKPEHAAVVTEPRADSKKTRSPTAADLPDGAATSSNRNQPRSWRLGQLPLASKLISGEWQQVGQAEARAVAAGQRWRPGRVRSQVGVGVGTEWTAPLILEALIPGTAEMSRCCRSRPRDSS
jgi:hypothetical protein